MEAIIIPDFAKNYCIVVQDAVQGYYWNNSQATLNHFAVYYRGDECQLCSTHFCVISDCHKHDVVAVHSYLKANKKNLLKK